MRFSALQCKNRPKKEGEIPFLPPFLPSQCLDRSNEEILLKTIKKYESCDELQEEVGWLVVSMNKMMMMMIFLNFIEGA